MKFQRRRTPEMSVDLTPLIDVVFLLLIFFMVTTTFVQEGRMSLELPQAESEPVVEPLEPVQVIVSVEGDYAINGQALADRSIATLRAALRDASAGDVSLPMVITSDGRAPLEAVVRVMDAAGQLGFERIRIATQPASAATP